MRLPGEACGTGMDAGLGGGWRGPSSEGGGRLAISRVRLLTGNWEKETWTGENKEWIKGGAEFRFRCQDKHR